MLRPLVQPALRRGNVFANEVSSGCFVIPGPHPVSFLMNVGTDGGDARGYSPVYGALTPSQFQNEMVTVLAGNVVTDEIILSLGGAQLTGVSTVRMTIPEQGYVDLTWDAVNLWYDGIWDHGAKVMDWHTGGGLRVLLEAL